MPAPGILGVFAVATFVLTVTPGPGVLYLGISAWRHPDAEEVAQARPRSYLGAYGRGLVVQLLNPKVAVFFVAYFPQFIRPGQPVVTQVLVLGATYLAVAIATDTGYVLLSSWLADRFARTPLARRRRARLSALIYFALAIAALVIGDRAAPAKAFART